MRNLLFICSLLVACKGGSDSDTDVVDTDVVDTDTGPVTCADATSTGLASFTIAMEPDLIPSMDSAPVGSFSASVYAGEDVTALGPNDGAVPLADLSAADIDLTDGGPAALGGDPISLPACAIAVLGCLDVDGNDCDKSDPVTLPNDNFFVIEADTTTEVPVFLGLLNPN